MGQKTVEVNISQVMLKICLGNVVCAMRRFLLLVQITYCFCAMITAKQNAVNMHRLWVLYLYQTLILIVNLKSLWVVYLHTDINGDKSGSRRIRNPANWRRVESKRNREMGKSYVSAAGKLVPEKVVCSDEVLCRPNCSLRRCSTKLSLSQLPFVVLLHSSRLQVNLNL